MALLRSLREALPISGKRKRESDAEFAAEARARRSDGPRAKLEFDDVAGPKSGLLRGEGALEALPPMGAALSTPGAGAFALRGAGEPQALTERRRSGAAAGSSDRPGAPRSSFVRGFFSRGFWSPLADRASGEESGRKKARGAGAGGAWAGGRWGGSSSEEDAGGGDGEAGRLKGGDAQERQRGVGAVGDAFGSAGASAPSRAAVSGGDATAKGATREPSSPLRDAKAAPFPPGRSPAPLPASPPSALAISLSSSPALGDVTDELEWYRRRVAQARAAEQAATAQLARQAARAVEAASAGAPTESGPGGRGFAASGAASAGAWPPRSPPLALDVSSHAMRYMPGVPAIPSRVGGLARADFGRRFGRAPRPASPRGAPASPLPRTASPALLPSPLHRSSPALLPSPLHRSSPAPLAADPVLALRRRRAEGALAVARQSILDVLKEIGREEEEEREERAKKEEEEDEEEEERLATGAGEAVGRLPLAALPEAEKPRAEKARPEARPRSGASGALAFSGAERTARRPGAASPSLAAGRPAPASPSLASPGVIPPRRRPLSPAPSPLLPPSPPPGASLLERIAAAEKELRAFRLAQEAADASWRARLAVAPLPVVRARTPLRVADLAWPEVERYRRILGLWGSLAAHDGERGRHIVQSVEDMLAMRDRAMNEQQCQVCPLRVRRLPRAPSPGAGEAPPSALVVSGPSAAPAREVLASHPRTSAQVTGRDAGTLAPGTWLNDEVINLVVSLLQDRDARWREQGTGGAEKGHGQHGGKGGDGSGPDGGGRGLGTSAALADGARDHGGAFARVEGSKPRVGAFASDPPSPSLPLARFSLSPPARPAPSLFSARLAPPSSPPPRVHIFSTFFCDSLYKTGGAYDYSRVRRWTGPARLRMAGQLSPTVLALDRLLFPVHQGVHWVAACIDLGAKTITLYDSLGGKDNGCLSALARWLRDEINDKGKALKAAREGGEEADGAWGSAAPAPSGDARPLPSLPLSNPDEVLTWPRLHGKTPAQRNGSDCGVFMLSCLERLARGEPLEYDQEDMPALRIRALNRLLDMRIE